MRRLRPPEISRSRPALILFLIDESGSMGERMRGGERPKAEAVCAAVNRTIENLIIASRPKGELADYFHVGAIGYGGETIRIAFGGALADEWIAPITAVAERPCGRDKEGHVWVVPQARGMTPMVGALAVARDRVETWVADFPGAPPPIVLNITDGWPSDGDPGPEAARLRGTHDGVDRTLLFNFLMTAKDQDTVAYPASPAGLDDGPAQLLYGISSELPSYMMARAQALQYPAQEGSRGFVLNGDVPALADFLALGTRT